jgi:cell division protein FtsQ
MEDDRLETGMDLEHEEEPQYLRRQKRVEVRKRLDTRKIARLKLPVLGFLALLVLGGLAWGVTQFALTGASFVLRQDGIEIRGARYVARSQVMERFTGDIGKSSFAVPLDARRASIEQIPWVERADIARLWPDRIRIVLHERTPVAFARGSSGVLLVDGSGQFLDRPMQASFSFPVVNGVAEKDPPEQRGARMGLFRRLMQELDREGNRYSLDISEVDVSDPEDARVTVVDTGLLLHLGSSDFLARYKTYLAHAQEWQRDHPKIRSIDLRYGSQVVVSPD